MKVTTARYYLVFIFTIIGSLSVSAQDIYEKYDIHRSPFRVILNKFSLTATTGVAFTTYNHQLEGVYFYQDADNQFIFSNEVENLGASFSGYTDWFNDPQPEFQTDENNPFDPVSPESFLVNTDTAALGFRGGSRGIPIQLSLHYNYKDFRIGLGYSYEFHYVRPLSPTHFSDDVRTYQPNIRRTRYSRFYGMLGYRFYSFWDYDFVAEVNVGRIGAGRQFDKSDINRKLYANVGISIENNLSQYFRIVVRPSMEFKSYTLALPDGASVKHRYPTFFIQAGVSINFPDIPRTPMKSDHVQLKHVYTDPATGRRKEVRGQPLTKKQNPKIGQNHRKLWRYKRKNKKKLNPY